MVLDKARFPRQIHTLALWVMTPCSLVSGYERFEGTCCFHLQVRSEDGGCMFFRNDDTHLPNYTVFVYVSEEGTTSIFRTDGGSMFVRNDGTHLPDFTVP
jgi:hypothetical protein